MQHPFVTLSAARAVILAVLVTQVPTALAVPSFARQTGMACEACHTVYPELTHFGRVFKASGYVLDNLKQVRDVSSKKEQLLELAQTNDSGTLSIDNTDLRFADTKILPNDQSLIYGVSLNNNPTVQDLWNTTPAFGFPYASSNAMVSPLASTTIDGGLAQDVAGLSAYAFWNESVYAEVGAYRSAKQGVTNQLTGAAGPLDGTVSNVIEGVAPYWRVAYEHNWDRHSLEVGMYGADFKLLPGGSSAAPAPLRGPFNRFKDVAEDIQYQFLGEEQLFTLEATHIHESMSLDASFVSGAVANPSNNLTTTRLWATYYHRRRIGGTLAYFSTTGSADTGLYPAAAPGTAGTIASATGSPDTRGWTAEVNYLPWLNTKFSIQYTKYTKFNGGSANYDGVGRNASDNDTLYFLLWFSY